MQSHIAIELIKTLNENELKRFGEFVSSPFFNKREVLIRLFEIILKHAPDFSSPALKKENLYKKLFPGKKYNEQTLRSRMSELTALIKEFLIEVNFKEDTFYQRRTYISELIKRKKFDLAEKSIADTKESLDENIIYNQNYFLNKLHNVNDYISLMHAKDLTPKALEAAYEQGEFAIHNFLLEILSSNNDVICYEIEMKNIPEFSFIKAFWEKFDFEGYINLLKEKNYEHFPILAAYYYGNMAQKHPESEQYFFELKELVYKYYTKFSKLELFNYWVLLSNSAYTNFLKKGGEFKKEAHEIDKFFIDNKLYNEEQPFSIIGYQNIATGALNMGDLQWGEEFLEKFKNIYLPELIDNRYYFCKALFSFQKKEFEKAIEYLSKVKFSDWNMKLEVRLNYLKNYYELGMSEQVFSLIDSFRHFSTNNPDIIPSHMNEKVKKTIDYFSKIASVKFGGKKFDYADFKEADSANYLYKKWILEKMKELL